MLLGAMLVRAVREVCSAVPVPVAERLSPFCSSRADLASRLADDLNRNALRSFEEFKRVRPEPVTRRDRAASDFPSSAGSPRAGDSDHNRDASQQGHLPLASSD